jgi:hypothetical protein
MKPNKSFEWVSVQAVMIILQKKVLKHDSAQKARDARRKIFQE